MRMRERVRERVNNVLDLDLYSRYAVPGSWMMCENEGVGGRVFCVVLDV